MTHYRADGTRADGDIALSVGDSVQLDWDTDQWWTVAAVTEHFAVCTRVFTEAELETYRDEHDESPDGDTLYTVIDWRNGVRGPCNQSGHGYGDGTYSPDECAAMLAEFEAGVLEVSRRKWAVLRVLDRRPAGVTP